jgi:hypothetical protein
MEPAAADHGAAALAGDRLRPRRISYRDAGVNMLGLKYRLDCWALLLAASALLPACGVGAHQRATSGVIGCPSDEIIISNVVRKAPATWRAHCRGRTFQCSAIEGDVSCSEDDGLTAGSRARPAASSSQGGCEHDGHCKGDRICEQGRCVDPGSTGRAEQPTVDADACPEDGPREVTPGLVLPCLQLLREEITKCAAEGTVHDAYTFDSDGHALDARVRPIGEGSSETTVTDPVVIACVEQAAKHARLPPIDRPTFTVAFPYRLGESSAQTSGR